jgi:hypothetical protein
MAVPFLYILILLMTKYAEIEARNLLFLIGRS